MVEPDTPIKWPVEERLAGSEKTRGHMRKLLPTAILERRMALQVSLYGVPPARPAPRVPSHTRSSTRHRRRVV